MVTTIQSKAVRRGVLWMCMLFSWSRVIVSQPGPSNAVVSDPELERLQGIARQFESEVRIEGFDLKGREPKILIETTPGISVYSYRDNTVREARYSETGADDRAVFDRQAALSGIAKDGQDFFAQCFYRFFFVHELGHWVTLQVAVDRKDAGWDVARRSMGKHVWEQEQEANRISVAYWREHDPAYMARLAGGLRAILKTWPSPVPAGRDVAEYFNGDYMKAESTAQSYSWFQFTSVLAAYDEQPKHTLAQTLEMLPHENYGTTVTP